MFYLGIFLSEKPEIFMFIIIGEYIRHFWNWDTFCIGELKSTELRHVSTEAH